MISQAYQILGDPDLRRQYDYKNNLYQNINTQTRQENYTNTTTTYQQYYPPQNQNYQPYENSYDPINYISKSGLRRILLVTVLVLLVFIFGMLYFSNYMNFLNTQKHYKMALKIIEGKGNYKQALSNLDLAVKYYNEYKEARMLRAELYINFMYNPIKAIEDYDFLIDKDVNNEELYFLRAKAYLKAYNPSQVYKNLQKAQNLNIKKQLKEKEQLYSYYFVQAFLLETNKDTIKICKRLNNIQNFQKNQVDSLKNIYCK
jgi:curved DNA-binding protein CbpA